MTLRLVHSKVLTVLYLSGRNGSSANKNNESEKAFVRTKENVWCQNKDNILAVSAFPGYMIVSYRIKQKYNF